MKKNEERKLKDLRIRRERVFRRFKKYLNGGYFTRS